MKDCDMSDYLFKGPNAQETFMNDVDTKWAHSVYPHTKCTEDCKKRGMYTLQLKCRAINVIRDVVADKGTFTFTYTDYILSKSTNKCK